MRRLLFALPLLALLFTGCAADSLVGPQQDERGLVSADECNPDYQPC